MERASAHNFRGADRKEEGRGEKSVAGCDVILKEGFSFCAFL